MSVDVLAKRSHLAPAADGFGAHRLGLRGPVGASGGAGMGVGTRGRSEVGVEPGRAQFGEICCLDEMTAHVDAEVAFSRVALGQLSVSKPLLGHLTEPVWASFYQDLGQWRVSALAEVDQQLW